LLPCPGKLKTNIRLGWKGLPMTKTPTYYEHTKLHPYKVL
jgi:hypothetical protein